MGEFYIRGRHSWGAKPPRSITTQERHNVHTLVVHHTAGRSPVLLPRVKKELRTIQNQHMAQGWSDIGYNFLIDRYGRVWEGRGYDRVGAHTLNHNTGTIGISFMGNYENQRLTKRQVRAYYKLRERLSSEGIKPDRIKGHRQMPDQATACPGRHIMERLNL